MYSVPQRKRPRSYWNIPTSDLPRASLFESESYFLLGPVGTLVIWRVLGLDIVRIAADIEGGFRMVRRVEGAGIGLAPRAGPRGPGGALVTGVGYLKLYGEVVLWPRWPLYLSSNGWGGDLLGVIVARSI